MLNAPVGINGLRADVIECWKIFPCKCGICPEDIFVFARSGVTRGHSFMKFLRSFFNERSRFKIFHEFFSMKCRRRSFPLKVASTWNSLLDDIVAPETLESFKRAIRCSFSDNLFNFVWLVLLRYFVRIFICLLNCSFV